MNPRTIHAPRITRLEVVGVSLFADSESVDLDFSKPISCLLGANGVGKSTLIALANFALTGIVAKPSATFPSVDEFVGRHAGFAAAYFSGRVQESNRDTAMILVTFQLGASLASLERGLFDGRLIRRFAISDLDGNLLNESSAEDSQADCTAEFEDWLVAESGFGSFDQFIFWQLFVMTFDERRHLLFWDEKTLSSALMTALGEDPLDGSRAEALTRDMERLDSLARNSRWRASQATTKRQALLRAKPGSSGELSALELERLRAERDALELSASLHRKLAQDKETEVRDTSRTMAELAIRESDLQAQFAEAISQAGNSSIPSRHPVIVRLLNESRCDLCSSIGVRPTQEVQNHLSEDVCPLCGSSTSPSSTDLDALSAIDSQLSEISTKLAESRSGYRRVREEEATTRGKADEAALALESFLSAHRDALVTPSDASEATRERLAQYELAISEAMDETRQYREEREVLRGQLEPIMEHLVAAYDSIEKSFVPAFRRLAGQFIGRDVDVEFERNGGALSLRFEMDGQSRRQALELSESQQFFLDISLRMTLVTTFLSSQSTMLIDTPEGSLDIAYETRAGKLFHLFAEQGQALLLTSNLNSSNLMLELAKSSTDAEMGLFRMTDWVQLSDIQLESIDLFTTAFQKLEDALLE